MTTPATSTPGRPRIHFTPAVNWMNDPNGLIYHKGLFHLYFQYNPDSSDWGNMSWGHATSTDLIEWEEHAVALRFDVNEQVYSGSVVFDADNSSGFGTADNPPLVALYTSATARGQSQALAYSLDGGYEWVKRGVVLDRGTTDFRDPKVFRHGGRWVMVTVEAVDRQIHFFGSANLRDWEPLSVFGPYGAPDGVWECPDLFNIGHRWVLTLSLNPGHPTGGSGMQYIVGDFDGTTFVPTHWDWLDHGHDYYAGVTFSGLSEPVMIAWMSNWAYAREVPTHPWRGSTALPRRLSLRGERLVQQPAGGLAAHPVYEVKNLSLPRGRFELPADIRGTALRIQARIRPGSGAVELCVRGAESDSPGMRIRYSNGALVVDRSGACGLSLTPFAVAEAAVRLNEGMLDLDVWLDTTSVEIFADGGAVTMSEQVFTADDHAGVYFTTTHLGVVVEQLTVTDLGDRL